MAARISFDLSSGSADGPTYLNGQRGPYAAASLEQSGGFREGTENCALSLTSISRSSSTLSQCDMVNLIQSLLSDLKPVVLDQKFPRPRERIASVLGISPDDSLFATFNVKPLPASSVEELKRLKANLHEYSIKARERAKDFGEAASKIDKYYNNVLLRKRSRSDTSLSERSNQLLPGGSIAKTSFHGHLSAGGLELGPQKTEERAKTAVPNRRIRTSMAEVRMDVRGNGITRPSGPVDRDKNTFRLENGGAVSSQEKGGALPTGVDGWEKSKMKKKRSGIKSDVFASALLTKPLDGDRELKPGVQQRPGNDARPRLNNTQVFRSGPASGVVGVRRLDLTSQQNGLGVRPSKNNQDIGSFPNDRRDRSMGSDKESVNLKANNKLNVREENNAASPGSTTKVNASARAPRSSSSALLKASSNIHRAVGSPDNWEVPHCPNKLNTVVGANNRKRSASTRSSSPPVAQWVGQRPPKMSRVARRSNLPLLSSYDEAPTSDKVDNAAVNDEGLGFPRHLPSNTSQQSKVKGDHVSSTGLSESEGSGLAENKPRDKGKRYNEMEEKAGQAVQKVATLVLPSRKKKVAAEEDLGDGVHRQGRTGRSYASIRSGTPTTVEKLDNTATAKQLRSAVLGSENIESKVGRPPTKKYERKGYSRPRHALNNGSTELAGESDDDYEELLAAATSALETRHACFGSFWKQMEWVFGFISAEDTAYLKQQIKLLDESAACTPVPGNDDRNSKGGLEYCLLPSAPAIACRDDCSDISNGTGLNEYERDLGLVGQTKHVEPFLERLVHGTGTHDGISICQALLSAMIEEEDIEKNYYSVNGGEEYINSDKLGIHFGIDAELNSKIMNLRSSENFQTVEGAPSNGYRVNTSWRYHDELEHSKPESDDYNQLCIDDRILLELSEIGLYPETVPDLAQSEDEEITEGINRLEKLLHEQVTKKRSLLLKLEKVVEEATELQEKELERIALDRLLRMAYDKYMAFWAPNSSGGKSANKNTKQAILGFVKRTLARCREFEETGRSSFNEPAFRDLFLSVSSSSNLSDCIDNPDGEPVNPYTPARRSEISVTDHTCLTSQPRQKTDAHDKYFLDTLQSVNHLSEQTIGKDNPLYRVKKRELLLDDVVGNTAGTSLRAPSVIGSSIVSGTKGKRSGRDRDGKGHNREATSRNGTTKMGRPSVSNIKGERKNKTKPKQKTTQLSASLNGLLGKSSDLPYTILPSAPKSHEMAVDGNINKKDGPGLLSSSNGIHDLANDAKAIDLSNLQIPEIDVLGVTDDFGGQGQDIASWLNIDDDGLQDHDFMGLEIPMDDLSELNMMV